MATGARTTLKPRTIVRQSPFTLPVSPGAVTGAIPRVVAHPAQATLLGVSGPTAVATPSFRRLLDLARLNRLNNIAEVEQNVGRRDVAIFTVVHFKMPQDILEDTDRFN